MAACLSTTSRSWTLRAVAMTGVLYVHFWNDDPALEGVRVGLFFVLSGYLITRMLARARGSGSWRSIRNFYARRLLRLQLSAATIATASLSWHLIEAPIARLKRLFPVGAPPAAPLAKPRVAVSPDVA